MRTTKLDFTGMTTKHIYHIEDVKMIETDDDGCWLVTLDGYDENEEIIAKLRNTVTITFKKDTVVFS